MEELTLNDQIVIYDREATVSAYRSIEQGDADRCQCGGCKNFRQFRNQAYGPKLLSLLERLGIDPLKEWEVYWCGKEADERIEYGGWFPFIGEWSPKSTGKDVFSFPRQDELFYFTDSFPNSIQRFGSKVLAIESEIEVPKAADYISDWK
jgi:hypothetical protein